MKLKLDFSIICGMDCAAATTNPLPACAAPRCMTRCECAGMSFGALVEHMRAEGLSVPDACRRTGCGQLCTACLPDLESYLASGA